MCVHRCVWWMYLGWVWMRLSVPFWLDVCKSQCVCVCVPVYLRSQSLICSCSVAALFQVSQQPGEYLLAEPWANYLYSYLCIFLLCLSVGAFVFLPFWLSPFLSIWLGPISACTSMRRWLCLRLFLYRLSLSLSPTLSRTEWWSTLDSFYRSLFIQ